MQLKEFYSTVACSEENTTAFLRKHGLLDTANKTLPCHKCGSEMVNSRKRDRGGAKKNGARLRVVYDKTKNFFTIRT